MNANRVLVVDDQPNWREVISSLLNGRGYEVDTAATVEKAWDLLNKNIYHIAILDVRLVDDNPYDIQGIELLDKMKSNLNRPLPIVIMTGYSFEGMEDILCTKYGVSTLFNKGSEELHDTEKFLNKVKSLVNNR